MAMRAPDLVVHEGRDFLVPSSLPASILCLFRPPLFATKTLGERRAEPVKG
jgi:hypothetical protein